MRINSSTRLLCAANSKLRANILDAIKHDETGGIDLDTIFETCQSLGQARAFIDTVLDLYDETGILDDIIADIKQQGLN